MTKSATPRPSSTDRFRNLGADHTSSLPEFRTNGQLVSVAVASHPCYKKERETRYLATNPRLLKLADKIDTDGKVIKAVSAATIRGEGFDPTVAYIYDGSRRYEAAVIANARRAERGGEKDTEILIPTKIEFGLSLAVFMQRYEVLNALAERDDLITIASKARQMLDGDDDKGIEPQGIEVVAESLGYPGQDRYLSKISDPTTGLLALPEDLQALVTLGILDDQIALSIAKIGTKAKDGKRPELAERHKLMTAFYARYKDEPHMAVKAAAAATVKAGEVVAKAEAKAKIARKPYTPGAVRKLAEKCQDLRGVKIDHTDLYAILRKLSGDDVEIPAHLAEMFK